ncbi:hypothetical protein EMCRGX_G006237 [Ephydatia muelleri]
MEGYTDKVFYVWFDAPIGHLVPSLLPKHLSGVGQEVVKGEEKMREICTCTTRNALALEHIMISSDQQRLICKAGQEAR